MRVRDFGAQLTARGAASRPARRSLRHGVVDVDVALGDGNDLYTGQHGFPRCVDAGRQRMYLDDGKTGLTTTRTDFRGGAGDDTASSTPRRRRDLTKTVSPTMAARSWGGSDRPRQHPTDVERLMGSPHNDSLNGSNIAPFAGKLLEHFAGNAGDDIMTGGPAEDFFDMGRSADGADVIRGGGGATAIDAVGYGGRSNRIVATVGHGTRDDGEAGERDDVSGVERVFGGSGSDVISQLPNSQLGLQIFAGPGNDTLIGAFGPDFMNGDTGIDTYTAGPGADTIFAAHADRDTIDCGTNPFTVLRHPDRRRLRRLGARLRELARRQAAPEGLHQRRRRQLDAPAGVEEAALGHRPRARRYA